MQNIINKIKNTRTITIYGAGVVAQNAYLLLSNFSKKEVKYFLVSEYREDDIKIQMTAKMYYKPVVGIKDWKVEKDTLVVIATSPKYRKEIEEKLLEIGCENYIFLSAEVRTILFEEYYAEYFSKKEISLTEKWINIGEKDKQIVKIKNPFCEKIRNRNSCFSELGTILLPACMGDLELASETPYEYENVNLERFVNGVVFDLGANQGYFSVLAAAKGHTAYAFEPSKMLIANLKEYSSQYDSKIKVVEAAVSDYNGTGKLYIDIFSDDANSMVLKTNVEKTEEISVITLDTYVRENQIKKVDFIKADIEGAERKMLEGAREILKKHQPLLSICTYHLEDDPEVINKIIMDANPNYKCIQKEKKLYAYV